MNSGDRNTGQEDVILYDEKVLKVLAKVIAEYFSVPEITEILILRNVPESKICNSEEGSKILLEVFLNIKKKKITPRIENKIDEIALSGERYISRIIEDFAHPLSHLGDANKVKEFSEKIHNIVTHDNLDCYRFGKSFRIFEKGEYEIAEELAQESLQEDNIDLLRDNDDFAYLISQKAHTLETSKNNSSLDGNSTKLITKSNGSFFYKGKDVKLQDSNAYVKAFLVLYENVDVDGFCSYKKFRDAYKNKYLRDFKTRPDNQRDFNTWAQGKLTDGRNGIMRKTEIKDLVVSVRGKGFQLNNLIS